jgi:hypothetical protein
MSREASGVRHQASGLRNEAGRKWRKGDRSEAKIPRQRKRVKIIMESFKIT